MLCWFENGIPRSRGGSSQSTTLFATPAFCWQNKDVTEALQKVAEVYGCKLAEGVLSHQMKQFVIDANKVVLSQGNAESRVDDFEFEEHEVYGVDIVMSTGDGKVGPLQTLSSCF